MKRKYEQLILLLLTFALLLLSSCTGPQGEQGIQGVQGEKGEQGEQGIQGVQGEATENICFFLPDTVYCVVGREMNLYYQNFTNITQPLEYDIKMKNSSDHWWSLADRIRIKASAAFEKESAIEVYKNGMLVASRNIKIVAVEDAEIPVINAMFIGDSLTDAGYFLSELQNMMGDKLTLRGTRSDTVADADGETRTVYHEGRAGWSTRSYLEESEFKGIENTFYHPDTMTFDFSYYMEQYGAAYGDLTDVFIFLGTNDGVRSESGRETTVNNINFMYESIKSYSENIRIHIILPNLATVDKNYALTNSSLRDPWFPWNEGMRELWLDFMETYETIVPVCLNIDSKYDFNMQSVPVSDRNPQTQQVVNNNVHPNKYGYYKMSDVIYAYIVNCLG